MSRRKAAVLRSLLLVAAAAFIIFGASRWEVDTVFSRGEELGGEDRKSVV